MKDKVLIVDDVDINRMILREILLNDYDILEAGSGPEAIGILFGPQNLPDAVLLDIMMPDMDGFEVLERIKANPLTAAIPVLFITAADADTNETRGLKEGAVDYISKPFNPDVVKARVDNQIQLMHYRTDLEAMVRRKTDELTHTHETLLEALATIIEYRSLESGEHVRRTSDLSRLVVEALLERPRYRGELERLNYSSLIKAVSLHDIGKIGIPDSILLKNGPLTKEEFEVVKGHTVIGAEIIGTIARDISDEGMYLRHCKDICRAHHERWDGRGYPDGLAGEKIPLSARIVTIIDVYDALVNKRCYKPAFSHQQALDMLKEGAGSQFDPGILEVLDGIADKFRRLEESLADPN